MNRLSFIASPLVAAIVFGSAAAYAESGVLVMRNRSAAPAASDGLSIRGAKPLVNKLAPPDTSRAVAATASATSTLAPQIFPGSDGGPPSQTPGTRAFGTFGIPYTTTRVQLGLTNKNSTVGGSFLSSTSPYRQIGKLFLPSINSFCSATLIRRSVIVTAAHCIQDFGSGNSTFGNWVFVPGHYGPAGATLAQREPYGSWNWAFISRPATWANGTDPGSGAARNNDVAIIIIGKNASNQFLGDLIGWTGYATNNYSFTSSPKTGNLSVAAISTLGYPGLLDNGDIMQRTDGPTYQTTVGGALQYWQGSNFTGGSSGGPWIVNFFSLAATRSGGAVNGTAPNRAVVGVTSWGAADPNTPKDNYSSRFGQNPQFPNAAYGVYGAGNIGALLNAACTQLESPGVTYAAAGYCN